MTSVPRRRKKAGTGQPIPLPGPLPQRGHTSPSSSPSTMPPSRPAQPLHPPRTPALSTTWAFALGLLLCSAGATAATDKLQLTGGVGSVDGAAGGGLTPWAVIGTIATAGQWGATAFATRVATQDHALMVAGAAQAWDERKVSPGAVATANPPSVDPLALLQACGQRAGARMRRAPHDGQKPRRLQLKATSLLCPQSPQRSRRKPCVRLPHPRMASNSSLMNCSRSALAAA